MDWLSTKKDYKIKHYKNTTKNTTKTLQKHYKKHYKNTT